MLSPDFSEYNQGNSLDEYSLTGGFPWCVTRGEHTQAECYYPVAVGVLEKWLYQFNQTFA